MGTDDGSLPAYTRLATAPIERPKKRLLPALVLAATALFFLSPIRVHQSTVHPLIVASFQESIEQCDSIKLPAGHPHDFHNRTQSDRYDADKAPDLLIRNATIWTGEHDGSEWLENASLLLSRGLIAEIFRSGQKLPTMPSDSIIDAHGAFLTPGLFDMHSHIGVDSVPHLKGADDTNSLLKPILPYLRSLDGINTHDRSFKRTVAGGVTTALILPGSANNIGGQAFAIKLRTVKGNTPGEMVVEMPWNVKGPRADGQTYRKGDPVRWRHMKNAQGENIHGVYGHTRMDQSWNYRSAFEKARNLKHKQDIFCEKAYSAQSEGKTLDEEFPDDLELEALVDVLRGRVKVNVHCYETTDFQAIVDHSNEFQYPVAAFHHAHEAYLVPDLIKHAYGPVQPAVALFATNARYKRESWRGSEFAPKILNEHNITVIAKSDHPVLDSRYVLFEAQQFHHFGLPANKAMQSLTSNPANTAGFGHRLGYIRPKYDADVVLWDSHPLEIGATPLQVIIDGQVQLQSPHHIVKEKLASQLTTHRKEEMKLETVSAGETVLFQNVKEILLDDVEKAADSNFFEVLVTKGKITCVGECTSTNSADKVIDLRNGSILPPFIAYGPGLGLVEIIAEKSTNDGNVFDSLNDGEFTTEKDSWAIKRPVKAYDGLEFGGKHLKIAHNSGAKFAITPPTGSGFHHGLSVMFRTGAENLLEKGAVVKETVAMHVAIGHNGKASISTQISELQRLLTNKEDSYFTATSNGTLPLVINTDKADVIARLILLKQEVAKVYGGAKQRWIINGGAEAHLLATEIAKSGFAVILNPPRAKPDEWDGRRVLDGIPLTKKSAIAALHDAGVLVAIGVPEEWQARQLLWEAAWLAINSENITRRQAVDWISRNFLRMFDIEGKLDADFVAYEGDAFRFGSIPVWTASAADSV